MPPIAIQLAEQGREQSGESNNVRRLVNAGQAATSIQLDGKEQTNALVFILLMNFASSLCITGEIKDKLRSFIQTDYINQYGNKLWNNRSEGCQGADQHQLIKNRYSCVVEVKRFQRSV